MRTVIVNLSRLLADFAVAALETVVPLEIIAVLPDRDDLPGHLSPHEPTLVLLGYGAGETDDFAASLLSSQRPLCVLVIESLGRSAVLHWTAADGAPRNRSIGDLSRPALVEAFRVAGLDPA